MKNLMMIVILFVCSISKAADLYVELGAFHYVSKTYHLDETSDVYGNINVGLQFKPNQTIYLLYVDEIKAEYNHYSHPSTGRPFNSELDHAYDGVGVKAKWNIYSF